MESLDLQPVDAHWGLEPRANPVGARSVLDCGDGVFGVAAFTCARQVGGEPRKLERGRSQSGDFADSVTALQNLAALPECKPTTAHTEWACCANAGARLPSAAAAAIASKSAESYSKRSSELAHAAVGTAAPRFGRGSAAFAISVN